jgi:hypothetical protein
MDHCTSITAQSVASIGENAGCAPAQFLEEKRMILRRRRFKQITTLKDRLVANAAQWREEAKLLPPGAVRDAVLRKARQADAAADIDEWLRSPGLQSPRQ